MNQAAKRLFTALLICAVSVWGCTADKPRSENSAPDFTVKSLDGKTISSEDLKGKVVFLHFWTTWCRYCVKEIPVMNELYEKYEKQGVTFLAVSLDEDGAKAVNGLKSKLNIDIKYPVALSDSSIVEKFGTFRGLPSSFFIDRNWEVFRHVKGYVPKYVLEQHIKDTLNKKDS